MMHVDNFSAFTHCDPPKPEEGALLHLWDDYDLKQIKRICEESYSQHNITITWQHVKAHQDKEENREKDSAGRLVPLS